MGDATPTQVRRLAMDYLARREHGSGELISKLMQRGVGEREAQKAVEQLTVEGLQNDDRFADSYLRSQARRGRGPQYIQQGLCQRGVSRSDAQESINRSSFDWVESAYLVTLKKYGVGPHDQAQRAAQQRFLLQRGFEPDHIKSALARVSSSKQQF